MPTVAVHRCIQTFFARRTVFVFAQTLAKGHQGSHSAPSHSAPYVCTCVMIIASRTSHRRTLVQGTMGLGLSDRPSMPLHVLRPAWLNIMGVQISASFSITFADPLTLRIRASDRSCPWRGPRRRPHQATVCGATFFAIVHGTRLFRLFIAYRSPLDVIASLSNARDARMVFHGGSAISRLACPYMQAELLRPAADFICFDVWVRNEIHSAVCPSMTR